MVGKAATTSYNVPVYLVYNNCKFLLELQAGVLATTKNQGPQGGEKAVYLS